MKLRKLQATVASGAILAFVVLATPGLAQSNNVEEDVTDNRFAFSYDSSSGQIGSETSAERTSEEDAVYFKVAIAEMEDTGSGLLGKLSLRLDGDERKVYDGWFTLHIETENGDPAFHRTRPATIHLRPQPGQRRAILRFRFDIPSGDYEAFGSFEDEDKG